MNLRPRPPRPARASLVLAAGIFGATTLFGARCAVAADAVVSSASSSAAAEPAPRPAHAPHAANPAIPGYFADPSIVSYQGKHYLYATLDPWGGATLGCWESTDFANWTYRVLNWPTKAACTSPTSKGAMVWAPSVIRARDGRFFMYVSVGNEVWAGVAEHPLGPWRNALGDRPLIPENYRPGYHMIDAEAFIDDDGQAYLYWGSGWNWVNGRCFVVKLAPDMVTFEGEVRDVTPANYFEGPFMFKQDGRYHLTYSEGRTDRDTYEVRYAVGDSPFGPFTEAPSSPLLTTDRSLDVISPGHHTIFRRDGRPYIAYHRHSVPFDPKFTGRQICFDELRTDTDGLLAKVTPTHAGPDWLRAARSKNTRGNLATPEAGATADASASLHPHTGPERVLDDNLATWWTAAPAADASASGAWLRLDLGRERALTRQLIRLEYPWKGYRMTLSASTDGETWTELFRSDGATPVGSPLVIERPARARHLRIDFPAGQPAGTTPAVIEWAVF